MNLRSLYLVIWVKATIQKCKLNSRRKGKERPLPLLLVIKKKKDIKHRIP